jgi:hypothetical protein
MTDVNLETPTDSLQTNTKSLDTSLILIIIVISTLLGAFGGKLLLLNEIDARFTLIQEQVPKIMIVDAAKIDDLDPDDPVQMRSHADKIKAKANTLSKEGVITLWGYSVINAPIENYYNEK